MARLWFKLSEDQPGTNVLMVSTEETNTHDKRVILQNPSLPSISDTQLESLFTHLEGCLKEWV